MSLAISFTLLLLALHPFVSAVIFPVQIRNSPSTPSLLRRGPVDATTAGNSSTVPIHNSHNAQYVANITLGGRVIPVLLDTGSSDLWVTGNIPGAKDTNTSVHLSYAIGKASGDIFQATLEFDNYTINDQAFLLVNDTSSFSTDINTQSFRGLMGLGPNTASFIRKTMKKAAQFDTVLNRLFQQNHTTSNFVSFVLDRQSTALANSDPTPSQQPQYTGQITVSEYVPGLERIKDTPRLDVERVYRLTDIDQHWQILTDKNNGIIGPDGKLIDVRSIAPRAPRGRLVAVIDSGFTFPQVPRGVADAIYGRVQGAVYDSMSQIWTLPCDQYLNLSINFGGVNFPVHPLDLVSDDFKVKDANGNPTCLGTFQPITSAFSLLGEYDIILGMAFLRNTYTLLDYGDFLTSSGSSTGPPFVQLLSLTNPTLAKAEFVAARLGGVDTTASPQKALLAPDAGQKSPIPPGERKKILEARVLSHWPYIFFGVFVLTLAAIGTCVYRCCRARRRRLRERAQGGGGGAALELERYSQVFDTLPPPHKISGGFMPLDPTTTTTTADTGYESTVSLPQSAHFPYQYNYPSYPHPPRL
jgi:hypothetical protein